MCGIVLSPLVALQLSGWASVGLLAGRLHSALQRNDVGACAGVLRSVSCWAVRHPACCAVCLVVWHARKIGETVWPELWA